ncbi:protein kinase C substrate 80K-H like protein [Heterostelium album PN500]|uniref:Glucosidase 2 subunit beta n=1 Tax=Heterostelium pallidum (strain ATCC 26659 / Pp 5 / PN500) TaxID=670386 RepID=D3BG08_HETP5|nr:protein kinase C substrate 80K-H like protein [Heterostelium album PN500]EFA79600.1 protein kinase C substrate 80K-H like protein [Heterostelium album PN500]|eukprot:XP_020431721.1 protein kinase C substrate 80K-H like protein [Heterostelium album PN500]
MSSSTYTRLLSSFALIFIICIVLVGAATESPKHKNKIPPNFGVSPEVASYYKSNSFNCFSSGKKIPIEQVNDDYCDCEDGSDEPGTAACSNGHFYCVNKGYRAESINSPLVNDGVCDCCDGSDEYEKKINCPNTCVEKGSVMRKEREEKIERYRQGLKKKAEMVEEAKTLISEKKSELERLKKEVEPLKEKIKEYEVKKELLEKQREDERKRLEDEREAAKKLEEANKPEQQQPTPTETEGDGEDKKEEEEEVEEKRLEEVNSELLESIKKGIVILLSNENVDEEEEDEGKENNDNKESEIKAEEEEEEEDDGPQARRKKDRNRNRNRNSFGRRRKPEFTKPPSPSPSSSSTPSLSSTLFDYLPESVQNSLKFISNYLPKQLLGGGEDMSDIDGTLATTRHDLREKEEQIEKIEKLFTYDHGTDNVYLPLYGKCFDVKTREYTYTVCPYDRASQGGTSLGKWEEWQSNYSIMSFQNGLQCWGGPKRSLTVSVECGSDNNASDVNEPSKCEYTMKFQTPAACDEEHLKVLQLEEGHVF